MPIDVPARTVETSTTDSPVGGAPSVPEFSLPSTASQTISLERYLGKVPVVLVFTNDESAGPTVVEALDRCFIEFGRRRIQLLVIAPGSIAHAYAMRPSEGTVPVLADGDGAVARSFEVPESGDGCTVVLIGVDGSVAGREALGSKEPASSILQFVDQLLPPLPAADATTSRSPKNNSPVVIDESGAEVNVEEWDPMPATLRRLDHVNESDLPDHPIEGGSPTG